MIKQDIFEEAIRNLVRVTTDDELIDWNIIIMQSNSLPAPAISQSSATGKPNAKGGRSRFLALCHRASVKNGE
jgi:hypothetical protein